MHNYRILLISLVLVSYTGVRSSHLNAADNAKKDDRYVATIEVKDGNVVKVLEELFKKRGVVYSIKEGVRGTVTCSFYDFDWELVVRYVAGLVNARVRKSDKGAYIVEPLPPPVATPSQAASEPVAPETSPSSLVPLQGLSRPSSARNRSTGNRTASTIPIRNFPVGPLANALGGGVWFGGGNSYFPFTIPYMMAMTPWLYPSETSADVSPGPYAIQYYNLFVPGIANP